MKKIITLMLLILSITLIGCQPKVIVNNEVLYEYFLNTKELYATSKSGHIKLTIENDEQSSVLEYIYNINQDNIESMKLVLTEGTSVTEAYIKDGNVYFNIGGQKTYTSLDSEEGEEAIDGYWFSKLTETTFKTLNKSIFNASPVTRNESKTATLSWNSSLYTFINEGFTDEEFLEADKRFYQVKDNFKEITITINYADELVKSLDSKWTNNDDEESTIKIEFLGTKTQNITYPADLNSYIER